MTAEKKPLRSVERFDGAAPEKRKIDPTEELLPIDEIHKNASDSAQELERGHLSWSDISKAIGNYLNGRKAEISGAIENLTHRQEEEFVNLETEQSEERETVRESTREKLTNLFSRSLEVVRKSAKVGFEFAQETQRLINGLDMEPDLNDKPVGKNLLTFLKATGGADSYATESGFIDRKNNSGNKFVEFIGGVNDFLDKHEDIKHWLETVVKKAISK